MQNTNNQFGKTLRNFMEDCGIKESQLAEKLNYDTTYISKWLNGIKLPSTRNVENTIEKIANYISSVQMKNYPAQAEEKKIEILNALQSAYKKDSSYMSFQPYLDYKFSFVKGKQMLIDIIRDAIIHVAKSNPDMVRISATFDLFRFLGEDVVEITQELKETGASKVMLKFALDPEDFESNNNVYANSILKCIGTLDYIEMPLYEKKDNQPELLTINDYFCLQIAWNLPDKTAAIFSMDHDTVMEYSRTCEHILLGSEKILDCAEPENLRSTNVQLESYADNKQYLFFNEPPAMLFPNEIMDEFIKDAETEEYAKYLAKLKNVFNNYTAKANIDLVVYASMINKYLSDGIVFVGNIGHKLNHAQVQKHLTYLNELMTQNPNFHIWLIRNAIGMSEGLKNLPSIFIDSSSVYIENSNKGDIDNFHISMDSHVCSGFRQTFEWILAQPYCKLLGKDDLLKYII